MNRSSNPLRLLAVSSSIGLVALLVSYRAGAFRPSTPVLVNISAPPSIFSSARDCWPGGALRLREHIGIYTAAESTFGLDVLQFNPLIAEVETMNTVSRHRSVAANSGAIWLPELENATSVQSDAAPLGVDAINIEASRIGYDVRSFNDEPVWTNPPHPQPAETSAEPSSSDWDAAIAPITTIKEPKAVFAGSKSTTGIIVEKDVGLLIPASSRPKLKQHDEVMGGSKSGNGFIIEKDVQALIPESNRSNVLQSSSRSNQ